LIKETFDLRFISVLTLACAAAGAFASGVLDDNYSADKTFAGITFLNGTASQLAFDGVNYWSGAGGTSDGILLAQYDADGNNIGFYENGLDARSTFSIGSDIYIHRFNEFNIYKQTSPGVFSAALTLGAGPLNSQSGVTFGGGEFAAMSGGVVSRWDASGNFLGTLALNGYNTQNNEFDYPQNRGLSYWNGYYLTYSQGVMSAWDASGERVGQSVLEGAGSTFDSYYSFGYAADGRVWVIDDASGTWRGYSLNPVPEPATMAALGFGILALRRRRRSK